MSTRENVTAIHENDDEAVGLALYERLLRQERDAIALELGPLPV